MTKQQSGALNKYSTLIDRTKTYRSSLSKTNMLKELIFGKPEETLALEQEIARYIQRNDRKMALEGHKRLG